MSGVSTGDLRTGNGTNLFSATYNSAGWHGDVKSYHLNADLTIDTTPIWSATTFLNPTTLNTSGTGNWSARRVLTFNDGLLADGTADTSAYRTSRRSVHDYGFKWHCRVHDRSLGQAAGFS